MFQKLKKLTDSIPWQQAIFATIEVKSNRNWIIPFRVNPKAIMQHFNPIKPIRNMQTELIDYHEDNLRPEWNFKMNKSYALDDRHFYTLLGPVKNHDGMPGELGSEHFTSLRGIRIATAAATNGKRYFLFV